MKKMVAGVFAETPATVFTAFCRDCRECSRRESV